MSSDRWGWETPGQPLHTHRGSLCKVCATRVFIELGPCCSKSSCQTSSFPPSPPP